MYTPKTQLTFQIKHTEVHGILDRDNGGGSFSQLLGVYTNITPQPEDLNMPL